MDEKESWADRLNDEVDLIPYLWQNRRWFVAVFILFLIIVGIFFFVGWIQRGSAIHNLTVENRKLRQELREIESENKGLREALGPLIEHAFSEFPGEETSHALKKVIARLTNQDTLRKPIASALVGIEVIVESDVNIDTHDTTSGGYLAFCRGSETLLEASTDKSHVRQTDEGQVGYSGVFQMSDKDSAVGKSTDILKDAEHLQITFSAISKNSSVVEGRAIIIINTSRRFEFQIPPQTMRENYFFVREVGDLIRSHEEYEARAIYPDDSKHTVSKFDSKEKIEEAVSKYFEGAFRVEVRGPLSIEQVEQESLRSILETITRHVRQDIPQVPFGFMNDTWQSFKQQLRGNDQIYYFVSDKASWGILSGRAGYVLVREGQAIDVIITSGN